MSANYRLQKKLDLHKEMQKKEEESAYITPNNTKVII
jgi:hypothetical protein